MKQLDLTEIIQVEFPEDQYYKESIIPKDQIVIHHTVSGAGTEGDIRWWIGTDARVATHIIIDNKGIAFQCYSSKYWGHHIGVKAAYLKALGFEDYGSRNRKLNQTSIGIELDAWGGLIKKNNKWYSYTRKEIPVKDVTIYPEGYRGYFGFEKYTEQQIEKLRQFLVFWNKLYSIPLNYNKDMWDISMDALEGKNGIWTHNSFRPDKSDCHPDPNLIEMLKSLKQ